MSIQASASDVVFSGHGMVTTTTEVTTVPDGVRLILLSPPGASISDELGGLLESGKLINALEIISPNTHQASPTSAISYEPNAKAPNLVLQPPRGLHLKPGVPHMIGVEANTKLADLWKRVEPFLTPGRTITCYWAACTALKGASNPVVVAA